MLPKTAAQIANGGIYEQRVRCGKSNCKCSQGSFHLAFYFFTRWNRKLIKFYVRKADLIEFSSLVNQATTERRNGRRVLQGNLEMLRGIRLDLREKQALINSLRT